MNESLRDNVRIKMKANANKPVEISHAEIAQLAYLKWESEGYPEGRSVQHWLDAERLLKTAKMALPKKAKVKPGNQRKRAAA